MNPRSVLVAALLAVPTGAAAGWGVPTATLATAGFAALVAVGYAAPSPEPRVAAWRGTLPLAAALVLAPYARFVLLGTAPLVFVGQAVATKVAAGAVLATGYLLSGAGGRHPGG